jgi:uncharacterized membrane protein YtjA (UPF0391 family)
LLAVKRTGVACGDDAGRIHGDFPAGGTETASSSANVFVGIEAIHVMNKTIPAPPAVSSPPRYNQAEPAPVEVFYWAAVSLVIALIACVLSYAAGTLALTHAANIACCVFVLIAGGLAIAGIAGPLARRRQ